MLTARELSEKLLACYLKPRWWSDDPYEVMFEAVLVQNTNWNQVEKTRASIGDRFSPEWVAALPQGELEQIIRPCGFFTSKARTILALTAWYSQYGYDSSRVREAPPAQARRELLSIRGVGEETADVILVYAFYMPSFIIDAYTRRFLERMGFSFHNDKQIRAFFESGLPRDAAAYGQVHWLLLTHGIAHCRKSPNCGGCPFSQDCAYAKEG